MSGGVWNQIEGSLDRDPDLMTNDLRKDAAQQSNGGRLLPLVQQTSCVTFLVYDTPSLINLVELHVDRLKADGAENRPLYHGALPQSGLGQLWTQPAECFKRKDSGLTTGTSACGQQVSTSTVPALHACRIVGGTNFRRVCTRTSNGLF